jgi:hypothetical protein
MLIQDEHFKQWRNADFASFSGTTFENCCFTRCVFDARAIAGAFDIGNRLSIADCHLLNCREEHCIIGPVVLDGCSIDGLDTPENGTRFDGALLKEVVVRGQVGKLRFLSDASGGCDLQLDEAIAIDNGKRYDTIDFAIDVSEAIPVELAVYGVPPSLIRLDPSRQCVVARENFNRNQAHAIAACRGTYFKACLENLNYFPAATSVAFSVPKDDPLGAHLKAIEELRRLGTAV